MAKSAPKAAPVEEEVEMTIHEELIDSVNTADPTFKGQGAKETEQQYYLRLMEAIGNLDEETWAAISDVSQAWYDKAVRLANVSKAVPTCPGFVAKKVAAAPAAPAGKPKPKAKPAPVEEEEEPAAEEEEAPEEEEEAAPPPKKKPGAKAAPAPAPAKGKPVRRAAPVAEEEEEAPADDEEEAPKKKAAFGGKKAAPFTAKDPKQSVTYQIRLLLVKNLELPIEKLRASLAKKGFPDVKSSTISTLRGDILATKKAAIEAGLWVEE